MEQYDLELKRYLDQLAKFIASSEVAARVKTEPELTTILDTASKMATFLLNLFNWFREYQHEQWYVSILLKATEDLMKDDKTETYRRLPANAFKDLIFNHHSRINAFLVGVGTPVETLNTKLQQLTGNLKNGSSPSDMFGPILSTLLYLFGHIETPHTGCSMVMGSLTPLIDLMNIKTAYTLYNPYQQPSQSLESSIPRVPDNQQIEEKLNAVVGAVDPLQTGLIKHPATAWSSPAFSSPYY